MIADPTLAVWTDNRKAGLLERGDRYIFNYAPDTGKENAVSLTMPVRLQSWVSKSLHPVFQMNMPEGALLIAIRNAIAKIAGVDDLTILRITGGHQIGRTRFSLPDAVSPYVKEKPESLAEILTYPDTVELFNELLARHALHSGISGVQPKVMLEAIDRATVSSESYIIKSWGNDYPHLAANEFFCMTAAKKAGLPVPEFHISENGGLFVMKRFDLTEDKRQLGFEDFCSLQALGTEQKYSSTYERVAKSIKDFVSPELLLAAREQFFSTLVLSSMVRNGDAHLKNFGVLYEDPNGYISLAPVYDIVTTTVYIKKDVPALSLAGTKKWWQPNLLEKFGLTYLSLPPAKIREIIRRDVDAVMETSELMLAYIADHPSFSPVGNEMSHIWRKATAYFKS